LADHGGSATQGLVIPSLTLPAPLRRPTAYGQTLGEIKLLVLGSRGNERSFLSGFLVEDNEDVVEAGSWEESDCGAVLRASTDWIEQRDAHGLEKYEPSRNVEIRELPSYDQRDDPNELHISSRWTAVSGYGEPCLILFHTFVYCSHFVVNIFTVST
jgi:hypothetical protein